MVRRESAPTVLDRARAIGCCIPVLLGLAAAPPARAADLGGDCCADLEERVTELEATTVRRGSRPIELTVSGTVNYGILYWDDGRRADAYVVTNDAEGSKLALSGETAEAVRGWTVGFMLELGFIKPGTSQVHQLDGDDFSDQEIEVAESHVWIAREGLGKLSFGEVGGSDDTENATEVDLSGTAVASYSGVEDIGGGFFIALADGSRRPDVSLVTWEDLIDHMPGFEGTLLRYDSPTLAGFRLSAEWGEDDAWEVSLGFSSVEEEGERAQANDDGVDSGDGVGSASSLDPFHVAAVISYHEILEDDDETPNHTLAGSISILHEPSGLNVTYAGAHLQYLGPAELNDGTLGELGEASFHYVKLGWLADLGHLGRTGFYGEVGQFRDVLGRDAEAELVASLTAITSDDVCAEPGDGCLVEHSEASIWGVGVVQHIDAVAAQVYVGYRHHEAEIGVVDVEGREVSSAPLEDFQTLMAGMLIEF